MGRNNIGKNLVVTSFGESHGPYIGCVIDGFPANVIVDYSYIKNQLLLRAPGKNSIQTDRKEKENFEIISGIFEDKTTGAPICILIKNENAISKDYENLKNIFRPSHADFTYEKKYGIRDYKGGGRSSARVTAAWVAAGAMAQLYLKNNYSIDIFSFVKSIYNVEANINFNELNNSAIYNNPVYCPDEISATKMEKIIAQAKLDGDSLGGKITCVIKNCKVGIGEPVFGKLHAQLAHAMMNINAVKSVEIGFGEDITKLKGSQTNDTFYSDENKAIRTKTNYSGGVLGGISNGEDIIFTVGFKPTASINKTQQTVNNNYENIEINITGRHDPCVVPRAVPIVSNMAALVLMDLLLEDKTVQ